MLFAALTCASRSVQKRINFYEWSSDRRPGLGAKASKIKIEFIFRVLSACSDEVLEALIETNPEAGELNAATVSHCKMLPKCDHIGTITAKLSHSPSGLSRFTGSFLELLFAETPLETCLSCRRRYDWLSCRYRSG